MRAWIEMTSSGGFATCRYVALFMRAWIEILAHCIKYLLYMVALFMRAWIEIYCLLYCDVFATGRPLHEGVD